MPQTILLKASTLNAEEINKKIKKTAKQIQYSIASDWDMSVAQNNIAAFNVSKYVTEIAKEFGLKEEYPDLEQKINSWKLPSSVVLKNLTDERLKESILRLKTRTQGPHSVIEKDQLHKLYPRSEDKLDTYLSDEIVSHILSDSLDESIFGESQLLDLSKADRVSHGMGRVPIRHRYRRAYILDGTNGTRYGPVRLNTEYDALEADKLLLEKHAQSSDAPIKGRITRPGDDQWRGVDYPTDEAYEEAKKQERQERQEREKKEQVKERKAREKGEKDAKEKAEKEGNEHGGGRYIPGSENDPDVIRAKAFTNQLIAKMLWEQNKNKSLEQLQQERIRLIIMSMIARAAEGVSDDFPDCGSVPIKLPRRPSLLFPQVPSGPINLNFFDQNSLPINVIEIV